METTHFDVSRIKNILEAQRRIDRQIQSLTVEKEQFYTQLDQIVIDAILKVNWKPFYDEKAVFVDLVNETAWHVWFLEQDFRVTENYYRFREVPNDFPIIFNYYAQQEYPKRVEGVHEWILPMSVYQAFSQIMDIYMLPNKHESITVPPMRNNRR